MGNKKVSVIIPCFNAAKWLPQCFLSLAGQTIGIHNLQLIFVNDASTDDGATWNLLQEMERAYPDDVLIIDLAENRRQGGARNEGLKYTGGSTWRLWMRMTGRSRIYMRKCMSMPKQKMQI